VKQKQLFVLVVLILVGGFCLSVQAQNKGAAKMVINGGKSGNVPFSHHLHQEKLPECTVCHDLFPQKPGIIDELKANGTMKKKTVMKNCQKCHRKTKKAGMKSGPVGCKKCHSIKG
jgi:c(7)-type cytochrome triheme protein